MTPDIRPVHLPPHIADSLANRFSARLTAQSRYIRRRLAGAYDALDNACGPTGEALPIPTDVPHIGIQVRRRPIKERVFGGGKDLPNANTIIIEAVDTSATPPLVEPLYAIDKVDSAYSSTTLATRNDVITRRVTRPVSPLDLDFMEDVARKISQ